MKSECFIYHFSLQLKQNDQSLTNYYHLSNTTVQMYIRANKKKYRHMLNDKFHN